MDKNHIYINYYVDWKTTDWLKDLFETNGFEWSDEFEEETQTKYRVGQKVPVQVNAVIDQPN